MKDILFKGQDTQTKEWREGDLIHGVGAKYGRMYILPRAHIYPKGCHSLDGWEVVPETVGQFVNLTDKNCNPAFVGNIYKEIRLDGTERLYRIFEVPGGFAINQFQDDFYKKDEDVLFYAGLSDAQTASFLRNSLIEIGNVHDNPELLKS